MNEPKTFVYTVEITVDPSAWQANKGSVPIAANVERYVEKVVTQGIWAMGIGGIKRWRVVPRVHRR